MTKFYVARDGDKIWWHIEILYYFLAELVAKSLS